MRFFTLEWWKSVDGRTHADHSPQGRYKEHLLRIYSKLPVELRAFDSGLSLEFASIRSVDLRLTERSLTLVFGPGSEPEWLSLHYGGVERFESTADPATKLPGVQGYGSLGHCEVDVLPSGAFGHYFLFSSGIELSVVFREFRFERTNPELAEDVTEPQ